MKTWVTMPLRPWGSQVSLAWLRCVIVLLPFRSSTILICNLLLILAGAADDERSDGLLSSLRVMSRPLEGESSDCRDGVE